MADCVKCGCGGEPVVGHIEKTSYLPNDRWYIGCPKCDICTGLYDTEAEVVQAWNLAMGAYKEFEWCNSCREYDHEKHCCHRWSQNIRRTIEEMKAQEKTAHVEVVEKPNVYKCSECGQYLHRTSWGSPVDYCSRCGAKLDWSENDNR